MARLKLFCARALTEWGSDNIENTKLLHDTERVLFYGGDARAVQDGRRAEDPNEKPFANLNPAELSRLNARIASIQQSRRDFVPPAAPVR